MALATGLRPRTQHDRLHLVQALQEAPLEVALDFADDGWAAAIVRITGRVPVWRHASDPSQVEQRLRSLGLPGLGSGPCWATLHEDLRLSSHAPAAWAPLPPVVGPLVTVIICTYNRSALLAGAIESALAQRWPTEVVVVDDGSTDHTREVLARFDGIRVIHQANTGKPGALAAGIAAARGDGLLVLDDDDRLYPGALHVLGRALFSSPDRVAVFGDTVQFCEDDPRPRGVHVCSRMPGAMAERVAVQEILAMPGACLVRTRAQRRVGDYEPDLVRGQDMDMFLRLARVGPMEALPLPVFRYRVHQGVRGRAGERYDPRDEQAKKKVFLRYTQPVFLRRWTERAEDADRTTRFDYALGLHLRSLPEQARDALATAPPPYSAYERWVRQQLGLTAGPAAAASETLVVVDDGDPGALEETLYLHAHQRSLWVDLEVPREPLGSLQRFWPGQWGAREPLDSWLPAARWPVHLRLSSDPRWSPPPLRGPELLPSGLAPRDQVLAVAAILGWPPPGRHRPGLKRPLQPAVARLWATRQALLRGEPRQALSQLAPVLEHHGSWRGAWRLGAEVFETLGLDSEADECRRAAS